MSSGRSPVIARVAAIDAYRGFVMFLMMAEVLHLSRVASAVPDNSLWQLLANHQTHAEWTGCSLHDLIQPSFSFLVGVALPFSIASRLARGQSRGRMVAHATWRALVLVLLGVFLRSVGKKQTYWTFEDTLSQIGLGYVPLFLLGLTAVRGGPNAGSQISESSAGIRAPGGDLASGSRLFWCFAALVLVLAGYWAAFALYPLPGLDFDYSAVGVPENWPHLFSGFAAHWNKNSNLAWAVDTWFLNLFPREKPFTHNGGGYATLSFIPTLGTMILGLIAGEWLRRTGNSDSLAAAGSTADRLGPSREIINGDGAGFSVSSSWATGGWLVAAGLACMAAGYALDSIGLCPSVKRIWTPAWTLFSGGWCFLFLAAFFGTIDAIGFTAWSFPLRVIGANSIAAYCIAHLWGGFIISSFKTHIGANAFGCFGSVYEPLAQGIAVLAVYWLILLWMYRRRVFLRI